MLTLSFCSDGVMLVESDDGSSEEGEGVDDDDDDDDGGEQLLRLPTLRLLAQLLGRRK